MSWHMACTVDMCEIINARRSHVCVFPSKKSEVKSGCDLLALPMANCHVLSRFTLPIPGWARLSLHHGL